MALRLEVDGIKILDCNQLVKMRVHIMDLHLVRRNEKQADTNLQI